MRILFITSTRIGDAVLSTGLLRHLQATYPGARFTIACGPVPAPLFAAVPGLERIIVLQKKSFARHWLALWTRCVPTLWDLVVDLRRSPMPYVLVSRSRRTLGASRPGHQLQRLAAVLGLDPPPAPRLWIGETEAAEAQRLIPPGGAVLGIGPTANWLPKTWPAERFAALAARLTAPEGILPGARIALFGEATERATAQSVIDAIPEERCIDLVGRIGLATVAACLTQLSMYVGNDSGLMHMAAAVGTPTLGLFGPSPPEVYAPWGPHTAVAATATPYKDLVASPGFSHRDTKCLMDSLSVDAAALAARALWYRRKGAAA
jgi:lipopolysaccharide export system permease protein